MAFIRNRKLLIVTIVAVLLLLTQLDLDNFVSIFDVTKHIYSLNFLSRQTKPVICVLVLACNRPSVKRCLDSVFKYRVLTPSVNFPVIVSQDCGSHPETTQVIKSYGDKILHIHQPDLSAIITDGTTKQGYYKQARHHAWALKQAFYEFKCPNVIVLEDDLEVAPDFFEYFAATLPLYLQDTSILCVTASNLQAKPGIVNMSAINLLHRTDFFFGWGWMISKKVFKSLGSWPKVYWDVWLGLPDERQGRSCIRPEIPRTKNFGRDGTSGHKFFDDLVQDLVVSKDFIPFTTLNLSYLLRDNYNRRLSQQVSESKLITNLPGFELGLSSNKYKEGLSFHVLYHDPLEFRLLTKYFRLYGKTMG
ncbi:unnamed protein product [Allacma fusca]|uniref:Alpha-1,3-mannosyl-glycoprotein 2-beta-N-acetylglucosaminyltransferase n=1 Tax=Allacma fusca TaxID=39272 RepID=A0A8J2JUM2_9HEXA|nr:unnamed protein product [Allacma fusca]